MVASVVKEGRAAHAGNVEIRAAIVVVVKKNRGYIHPFKMEIYILLKNEIHFSIHFFIKYLRNIDITNI